MKKTLKKIKKYIKEPYRILIFAEDKCRFFHLSDKIFIPLKYRSIFNKKLDLKNPQTFNEKIQWLKLNDRKDIYTTMVDKHKVKKYVADIIGEEYIIPTLGVYDKFDEIDFSKLPNQFVIKCTHDSGGVIIVKDKNKLDLKSARKIINKSLRTNFYYYGREWPYKNVKPKIIIEQYLEDNNDGELRDYKFFCFDGKFKIMFIATNRQGNDETKFDFFNEKLEHLNIINGHPNSDNIPHMPINIDKMISMAELISKNIPQVRVDFYECNGKVYFGELTFSHWSGFMPFYPEEWDYKLGSYIKLPKL